MPDARTKFLLNPGLDEAPVGESSTKIGLIGDDQIGRAQLLFEQFFERAFMVETDRRDAADRRAAGFGRKEAVAHGGSVDDGDHPVDRHPAS